jgi:hypothetical protein
MGMLWTKAFQMASRRDVVVASVVGLCGLGLFLVGRQWLPLTRFEKQLIQEAGSLPRPRCFLGGD